MHYHLLIKHIVKVKSFKYSGLFFLLSTVDGAKTATFHVDFFLNDIHSDALTRDFADLIHLITDTKNRFDVHIYFYFFMKILQYISSILS